MLKNPNFIHRVLPLAVVAAGVGSFATGCAEGGDGDTTPPSISSTPTPGKDTPEIPECHGIAAAAVPGNPNAASLTLKLVNIEMAHHVFDGADYKFGDGNTLKDGTETVEHTFPGPGTYDVSAEAAILTAEGSPRPNKIDILTCIASIAIPVRP